MNATKMYDRAATTVRDLVEEMPDLNAVKDVAEEWTGKAGEWMSDTGEKIATAVVPGMAAKAARTRRRRLMWIGLLALVAVAVLASAERRAKIKEKLGMGPQRATNPSLSTQAYRNPVAEVGADGDR